MIDRIMLSCEDCVFCIDVCDGYDERSRICNLGLVRCKSMKFMIICSILLASILIGSVSADTVTFTVKDRFITEYTGFTLFVESTNGVLYYKYYAPFDRGSGVCKDYAKFALNTTHTVNVINHELK